MIRARFLTAAVFIHAFCIVGDDRVASRDTAKQPWEWTTEARINARMDDAEAASRVQRDTATSSRVKVRTAAIPDSRKPFDVIDGRRDPHLFFETELFDQLLRMAYAEDELTRYAYRESKERELKQTGMPSDTWQRLEVMTAPYRASRARERDLALSGTDADRDKELAAIRSEACQDRVVAMRTAHDEFGMKFSRFLYAVVAPTMRQVIYRKPSAALTDRATGVCQ